LILPSTGIVVSVVNETVTLFDDHAVSAAGCTFVAESTPETLNQVTSLFSSILVVPSLK
jgi:hypothetical protein